MYLEVYNKDANFHKYVIGSVYRRPFDFIDDLKQFIEEFSTTLNSIHSISKQAYINGDYDIDLLHYIPALITTHFMKILQHRVSSQK